MPKSGPLAARPPLLSQNRRMNDPTDYTPPRIWTPPADPGGRFAAINRPTAGATHEAELTIGRHPLQLYSLATPNGVKVTVMLEELLALGHAGAEYDAWPIQRRREVRGSGFVAVNPNSKIPALLTVRPQPVCAFESGAILVYLLQVRRPAAHQSGRRAPKVSVLVVLADGESAVSGRRLRPLYAYAPAKWRWPDRLLRDGGQAPVSTCSTAGWPRRLLHRRREAWHDRRHRDLALVWRACQGAATRRANSHRCRTTGMSSTGPTASPVAFPP